MQMVLIKIRIIDYDKSYPLNGSGKRSAAHLKEMQLDRVLDPNFNKTKDHPKKNVLMKALGANNPIDIDIFDCDMDVSSIFLCSDGLTSMLDEEQIEKVVLSELEIEDKVIKLIRKSNNRGGNDNISIAYLEFSESGD